MSYALFGLLYSTMSSLLLIMGTGCAINKAGDFFKLLEEESEDNFKKAFDKVAGDLVNDFNNSFVSLNLISSNVSKLAIIFYELIIIIQRNAAVADSELTLAVAVLFKLAIVIVVLVVT